MGFVQVFFMVDSNAFVMVTCGDISIEIFYLFYEVDLDDQRGYRFWD